ncbi:hypothetical protein [Helicobacter pylori]|uniref:hypothetical protein n=1 Tax=Helicobacter pylori TaxID=210 RepID=UPI0013CE28BA|nr:hypothetical protein [Helicobacter pylori]
MFQKKKKKDFWGVLEPFSIIKKVLKFVLIKDSDKMGVWLLGGIALDLVARLLRGCFGIALPLDF